MKIIDLLLYRIRLLWHLLFWAGAFLILLNIFRVGEGFQKIDVLYTIFFMLPLMIAVYINLYLLIPLFLQKQRLLFFLLSYSCNLISSSI